MCRFVIILMSVLCFSQASELVKVTFVQQPPPAANPSSRIIGGSPANIKDYPFTVQVAHNNALICGGSLLTIRHVMSAAHCFYDNRNVLISASQLSVRVGSAKLNSGGKVHRVSTLVLHQNYNRVTQDSDIAILVLSSNVKKGTGLALVPVKSYSVGVDQPLVYAGWGWTSVGSNQLSSVLMEVTVRKVNLTECTRRYDELRYSTGDPYYVTKNMICAGFLDIGGADACQGDSGGPLLHRNNVVVGITSWGYQCGLPTYPGVNTRVANFTDWIDYTVIKYNTGAPLGSVNVIVLISSLFASLLLFKDV